MSTDAIKRGAPDRSKICMSQARYWTRHFRISREELQRAIEKVGNSAAAVRKELANETDGTSRSPTSVLVDSSHH